MSGTGDTAEYGTGWGGSLRVVTRDGEPVLQLRCPGCEAWGDIDADQAHGRVSVNHSAECGYHETKDWWGEAEAVTGRVPASLLGSCSPSGVRPATDDELRAEAEADAEDDRRAQAEDARGRAGFGGGL